MQKRILDLALYSRHVELYSDYSIASGAERQAAFERLIRHAWRIRQTGMIHTLALYRDLDNRDKAVFIPSEAKWSVPEAKNPWKQDEAYTAQEVREQVAAGIRNRPLLDFAPVSFSDRLVSAAPLKLSSPKRGSTGIFLRGQRDYWTLVQRAPESMEFQVASGLVYKNRGSARMEVFPLAEPEGRAVLEVDIAPDKEEHPVRLETRFTGLHRIAFSDRGVGTRFQWPQGIPMTILSDPSHRPHLHGRWTLYAYVPRGSAFIGGFSEGVGQLLDPNGKVAYTFSNKPGYFRVPVPEGGDGKLWCFSQCIGDRLLMTIPPCLAEDAAELLLPEEVVERDAR